MGDVAGTVGRRYEVLRPHLTELQRRLFLGAEGNRSIKPAPRKASLFFDAAMVVLL